MQELEKSIRIYGVKTIKGFHYIGKTEKMGNLCKSKICQHKENIANLFDSDDKPELIELSTTSNDGWYDDKLKEVVKKYAENNPLENAQWMLDGKRGYWSGTKGYWIGKVKDKHTINRLSESKYKKLCQYDNTGALTKVWNSYKEAATIVFKDYKILKGGASSDLYRIIGNQYINKRFKHNSYWFSEKELIDNFGTIPIKLNISKILANQKEIRKANKKQYTITEHKKYSVIHYNQDGSIKTTYANTFEAAYALKTTIHIIQKLCRGSVKNNNYLLKYGEKTIQPVYNNYDEYTIEPLVKESKPIKSAKIILPKLTRRNHTVLYYENNILIKEYPSVRIAADEFKLRVDEVRYICANNRKKSKNTLDLRLGEKKQYIIM